MRISKTVLALLCLILCGIAIVLALHTVPSARAASPDAPAYAANGDMLPPSHYREWIYLTSGIDMSYSPKAMEMGGGMSMFDNVFVNPEAYRSFMATGTWPDKTIMVLEVRKGQSRGSINKAGVFQTDQVGREVHVKDVARFKSGWAFFPGADTATALSQTSQCNVCHEQHGAVDTTFVQFYPTLLPTALEKKTMSAAYLAEEAAGPKDEKR